MLEERRKARRRHLFCQDTVDMRHGVEPRLVRRLGDVDGGPRASLLEVSWSVSLNVAPTNADGPEEVDQTCVEVSALVFLPC